MSQGYSADSYQVKALQQARNEKLQALAAQQAKDEQQAFENSLALAKTNYDINKPYYKASSGGGSGSGATKNAAYAADYTSVSNGSVSPEAIRQNMQSLIAQYGVAKYNELLAIAEENYKTPYSGVADFRILAGEQ